MRQQRFKIFIFFFLMFFSLLLTAKDSKAKIINASSTSYADVNAAVAIANYGDTVSVPEGEADWGNNTLVITKGIDFLGAGKNKTIINSAPSSYSTSKYLISFNADATTATNDYQFRFNGFHLKANGTYPPYALLHLANANYTKHLTKVVVSNNKFQQLADSGCTSMSIALYPAVFGVTYNNEIIDGDHAWRFLGSLPAGKNVVYWEPGSQYAMYFEDNNIYLSKQWGTTMIISGGNGNRYVSRYNTFDLSLNGPSLFTQAYDIHGNQPNNGGGSIGFEAYGDHHIGGRGRWVDQRSGRVNFFMNKWSNTNGTGSYNIWEEYDDDLYVPATCAGLAYPKTAGAVNCLQKPYNSYYWRNFAGINGTALTTETNVIFDHYNRSTPTLNNPLTMFENKTWWRDNLSSFDGLVAPVGSCGYYGGPTCIKSGIGCGTYDEMQTIKICAEGSGFWVTDQGNCQDISGYVGHAHTKNIMGTLYKCTSLNTWVVSYVPYTYPHPLRTIGDTTPPAPPSGLNVN